MQSASEYNLNTTKATCKTKRKKDTEEDVNSSQFTCMK